MAVTIMNKAELEEYSLNKHDKNCIVISIGSVSLAEPFVLKTTFNRISEILRVEFNDTEVESDISGAITQEQGNKIADFVLDWATDVDDIIVQCEEGKSRSAGVAKAIIDILDIDDNNLDLENIHSPNKLCYDLVIKGFKRHE